MISPVNNISAAIAGPTIPGSKSKLIDVAIIPRRINISLNLALSDAMRISQSKLSSMPKPTAAPLTALIIGHLDARIAVTTAGVVEAG